MGKGPGDKVQGQATLETVAEEGPSDEWESEDSAKQPAVEDKGKGKVPPMQRKTTEEEPDEQEGGAGLTHDDAKQKPKRKRNSRRRKPGTRLERRVDYQLRQQRQAFREAHPVTGAGPYNPEDRPDATIAATRARPPPIPAWILQPTLLERNPVPASDIEMRSWAKMSEGMADRLRRVMPKKRRRAVRDAERVGPNAGIGRGEW